MSNTPHRNHWQLAFRLLIVGLVATLTACGTVQQLASSVAPLSSKSQEQQQLDNLACLDQAKLEANTMGRQAGAFVLGLTIVGAPVAFELERAKQREVYKSCMEARGYRVVPPSDGQGSPATTNASAPAVPAPAPTKLAINLPSGWERNSLPDQMVARGVVTFATNRTTDSGVILSSIRRDAMTDLAAFATRLRASQESRLTDVMKTDLVEGSVSGRRIVRATVTGLFRNAKFTYSLSVIEGKDEVAIVNAWTTTANYPQQKSVLEALSEAVTGL